MRNQCSRRPLATGEYGHSPLDCAVQGRCNGIGGVFKTTSRDRLTAYFAGHYALHLCRLFFLRYLDFGGGEGGGLGLGYSNLNLQLPIRLSAVIKIQGNLPKKALPVT